MAKKPSIVDARNDKKGNITHVKIEGNERFTPVHKVIERARRKEFDNVHVVEPKDGRDPHLRTNPNKRTADNLDDMAEDD